MSEFTAAPIGCLIMAAGNASRFGENKLTASFAGKSLFSLALAAIPADTFALVTVVSQYPALLQEAEQAGFHAIRNDRPDDGISRTIRLGTEAMADCAGILYMVADQPLLPDVDHLHHGEVFRVLDLYHRSVDGINGIVQNVHSLLQIGFSGSVELLLGCFHPGVEGLIDIEGLLVHHDHKSTQPDG